jgi:N-acetylglutamate synthase-like GNAT family acetyltransferase
MTMRIAGASDLPAALAIIDAYQREAKVVVADDADDVRGYIAPGHAVVLALENDAVAGCVCLRPLPSRGTDAAELKRMAVELGYRRLYLDTAAEMHAAQAFYAKAGFERCEPYNENPQAAVHMSRCLD